MNTNKALFGFIAIGLVLSAAIIYAFWSQKKVSPSVPDVGAVACTLEAKICPDGSAVGRTGPNCEFEACPVALMPSISRENVVIEGKHLVYFRSFAQNGLSATVEVDPIQMFGGEEATVAAMQDSGCSREDVITCVPSLNNSFYIRNLSTSTQKFDAGISTDISVLSQTDGVSLEKVSALEMKKRLEAWPAYRIDVTPFWITVKNGKIVTIEQQYIP